MGKVVAILATLLTIIAIVHADAMLNEISLKEYPKLRKGIIITDWFTGENASFYIRYRLINTPNGGNSEGRLAIRVELVGKKNGGALDDIDIKGTYTIVSKDKSKSKQFHFKDHFDNHKKGGHFTDTLSAETLLDPANGYYNKETDTITIYSLIDYKVNNQVELK